jgi:hypothetical protein
VEAYHELMIVGPWLAVVGVIVALTKTKGEPRRAMIRL